MTTSSIINMARHYLKLGVIMGVIVSIAFVLGYFVLYKKVMKGEKRLRPLRLIGFGLFVCYLAVVCGATLERGGNWKGIQLLPFSSYLDAWYNFSIFAWRNLILNILLFIPFGFLLPFLFETFRKPWKTYLAGGLFSLMIEVMQLLFRLGIYETDDILNNFLGTVIGYGGYRLVCFVLPFIGRERDRFVRVMLFQIPLCLTILVFGGISMIYQCMELGNLKSMHFYRVSMKGVEVRLETELSGEEEEKWIYRHARASRQETMEMAKEFFSQLGFEVDMDRTLYYDDTAIYYSNHNQHLWIDYAGGVELYDFSAGWEGNERVSEKEGADREEVEEALEGLGISLPREAEFEELGKGRYLFSLDRYEKEGIMYDGNLTCDYFVNGKLDYMDNRIIVYERYRMGQIKTEREAYEEIIQGKFAGWPREAPEELTILSVEPGYEMDSKGFSQPIYVFDVLCDQMEERLIVPALK